MLWMRTCCVQKGMESENTVEIISRGCRRRCSYTLTFFSNGDKEKWYRLLKQESKEIPPLGDELVSFLTEEESYRASLDHILMDVAPLSVLKEVLHRDTEGTIKEEEGDTCLQTDH